MNLQPAQQTFIEESRDLLRDMEAALLELEKSPGHGEAIDAVFRAAHTIKGSAGVFELDAIVELTHAMENVLVEVRAGRIEAGADLIALLLSCGDHVSALIDGVAAGAQGADPALAAAGRTLIDQLGAYAGAQVSSLPEPASVPEHQVHVEAPGGATVASDTWHISLRFGRDVLRHGLDPLATLRYLGTLGKIVSLTTLFDAMPQAAELDPESCYVGFEIDFSSLADKKTIEAAFDFLREDCIIRILPPHSRISDYIQFIRSMPEDAVRLGELLVASGVLTQYELSEGLKRQDSGAAPQQAGGAAPQQRIGEILVDQGVVQNEVVDAALEKQKVIKEKKAFESGFVRVRADKLDELINLVGELVIASSGVNLGARRAGLAELQESAATLERLVEEVRDGALKLRMVPIGETFNRFNRVARDLGRELGKNVELILSGTETELDKSMVERISDPLMHLVRNALDHGIEPAAERERRGKPARGRLWLNAYHESGSITIEVADDGRGLDRARIVQRAVERGLAAPGETLSDRDIYRLVMEAGFSTAEEVTSVSGRGVGMDVVKRNVEALRGMVSVDSTEGEGTTIAIRLPLTLAIIDGFAVGVGSAAYVVPLEMVVECMELSAEERAGVRESGYINLRGEVLPLLRLRDVFEAKREPGKRENIVVVQYAGQQAGFVVDALMGEFQTVIKPLGKLFERLSGISGSTILGTGEVALILDVQALVQRAIGSEGRNAARKTVEENLLERK